MSEAFSIGFGSDDPYGALTDNVVANGLVIEAVQNAMADCVEDGLQQVQYGLTLCDAELRKRFNTNTRYINTRLDKIWEALGNRFLQSATEVDVSTNLVEQELSNDARPFTGISSLLDGPDIPQTPKVSEPD